MGMVGAHEAHAFMEGLHLMVRYDGEESFSAGRPCTRFRWRAMSLEPDTFGSYVSGPLFGRPGADAASADALSAIASALADAAEGVETGDHVLVDCPDWLTEIACRNIAELKATTAFAAQAARFGGPLADLLAVEVGREILRGAFRLLAADPGRAEDIAEVRDFVTRADPEVVVLPHAADPFGTPRYEGRAAEAHRLLEPGVYPARNKQDGSDMVVVVGETPFSDTELASAAFHADAGERPADPGDLARSNGRESRSPRASFWPMDRPSPSRDTDPPGTHMER